MTPEKATALRKPFPKESIGQLPKGGVMLDYVGHAAVTDRLLTVDPEWSWDFALRRADGTPVLDDGSGNLWITLTVCGVTRLGVGDGKNAKERIGDAIRNAAMRFGVALDLWAKENLVEFAQQRNAGTANQARATTPALAPGASVVPAPPEQVAQRIAEEVGLTGAPKPLDARSKLAKAMFAALNEAGIPDNERLSFTSKVIGREITTSKDMTEAEARKVLDYLDARDDAEGDEDFPLPLPDEQEAS